MRSKKGFVIAFRVVVCLIFPLVSLSQDEADFLSDFRFTMPENAGVQISALPHQFDGYTSHWTQFDWSWYKDGLFMISQPSPQSERKLAETDIGNALLLDELWIQSGFISRIAGNNFPVMTDPSPQELQAALHNSDLILCGIDRAPLIAGLLKKLPVDLQYRRNRAFFLQDGLRTLYVLATQTRAESDRLLEQIRNAKTVIENYNLFKGLAGVHSNYLLITPGLPHNPYNLINIALQSGCSWVTVSGYNDWMIPDQTNPLLEQIEFPFLFLPGQYGSGGVMYSMKRYPNIQNNTVEECLDWTEKYHGLYFSNLQNSHHPDHQRFSGYIVTSPADQASLDSLGAPILTNAGTIGQAVPPLMIVFLDKNQKLNTDNLWKAILQKHAVALFEKGRLLGPRSLVDALRVLMLEKEFISQQLDQRITIRLEHSGAELTISLQNQSADEVSGTLHCQMPEGIRFKTDSGPQVVSLAPHETKTLQFRLDCTAAACGRDLPLAAVFDDRQKPARALTHIQIPFPVEIPPLIFDQPGLIRYPVTLYNYTKDDPLVDLKITSRETNQVVYQEQKEFPLPRWQKLISQFEFSLGEGDYLVEIQTLGVKKTAAISIKKQPGAVTVSERDLDGDGIPEILMENDKIRASLLLFGGRVIEYTVKERSENLLFKLWPQKPPWDGQPRGVRAFYPWGGLEEFTGYPYIGGHIIFNYEIIEAAGSRGRVRLWADIHGSKIEKIITLYGGSALLEARYAMNDIIPSITVIGINPLIEIGPTTGPEDAYFFPAEKLEERRPVLDRYYGDMFFLKEGWAAGYDTDMDISLLIGYPVNDAMFLHLWNNHPDNTPTPYYYTELQPWLKIKPSTTTYFTYYLFGQSGNWQAALEKFRALGVVTESEKIE